MAKRFFRKDEDTSGQEIVQEEGQAAVQQQGVRDRYDAIQEQVRDIVSAYVPGVSEEETQNLDAGQELGYRLAVDSAAISQIKEFQASTETAIDKATGAFANQLLVVEGQKLDELVRDLAERSDEVSDEDGQQVLQMQHRNTKDVAVVGDVGSLVYSGQLREAADRFADYDDNRQRNLGSRIGDFGASQYVEGAADNALQLAGVATDGERYVALISLAAEAEDKAKETRGGHREILGKYIQDQTKETAEERQNIAELIKKGPEGLKEAVLKAGNLNNVAGDAAKTSLAVTRFENGDHDGALAYMKQVSSLAEGAEKGQQAVESRRIGYKQ